MREHDIAGYRSRRGIHTMVPELSWSRAPAPEGHGPAAARVHSPIVSPSRILADRGWTTACATARAGLDWAAVRPVFTLRCPSG